MGLRSAIQVDLQFRYRVAKDDDIFSLFVLRGFVYFGGQQIHVKEKYTRAGNELCILS